MHRKYFSTLTGKPELAAGSLSANHHM